MPLRESCWHAFLQHGIDLPGDSFGSNSGNGIFCMHVIREEDGEIAATEGVCLRPCKVFGIGFNGGTRLGRLVVSGMVD